MACYGFLAGELRLSDSNTLIEGPLGRAHRRPSIFDRQVWVPMSEEEHAIGNRRLLEALEEAEDGLSRFG